PQYNCGPAAGRLPLGLPMLLWLCGSLVSCGGLTAPAGPVAVVTVLVSPSSAQSFPDGTVKFVASVQNSPTSEVNWQVNAVNGGSSNAGTISVNGVYTAPSQPPSTGPVTITAVLRTDSIKTGSATVNIQSLSSFSSL